MSLKRSLAMDSTLKFEGCLSSMQGVLGKGKMLVSIVSRSSQQHAYGPCAHRKSLQFKATVNLC